ncbi:MAG: peptidoglycan DD-metalloendopeptidase family protein [Burkholderiales bacterium]
MFRLFIFACVSLVAGCIAGPLTAPVVDRTVEDGESTTPPKPVARDPATVDLSKSTKPAPAPDIYRIKEGDTLYSIALEYGLDYREVASWNGITDPTRISVGQILTMRNPRGTEVHPVEPEPVVVESKPFLPGEIPPGELLPEPAPAPLKTEPKAQKIPYSADAFARMQRGELLPKAPVPGGEVHEKPAPKPSTKAPAPAALPGAVLTPGAEWNFDAAKWLWPAQGDIVHGFDGSRSKGISITGKQGDPVLASAAGKVVYVGKAIPAYGPLVIVKHSNEFLSVYAHNSKILVKEGQQVAPGQKIAEMGERAAGQAALHFEIRKQGQPVDPMKYLPSR